MNLYVALVFLALLLFCGLSALFYIKWLLVNKDKQVYLGLMNEGLLHTFILRFGNCMLMFGNLVPISLVVTVEMVKYI